MHTNEDHTTFFNKNLNDKGLLMNHAYQQCAFSGAGNCCCGRPRESRLHPHKFVASMRDILHCVCGAPKVVHAQV